jgi:hypothetical protein
MPARSEDPLTIEYRDQMNSIYSEGLQGFYQTVSRGDFYGLAGQDTAAEFLPRLGLSPQSSLLDLCCGTGGPIHSTDFWVQSNGRGHLRGECSHSRRKGPGGRIVF